MRAGALASSLTRGLQEVEQWLVNELGLSEQQISAAVDRLIQTVRDNVGNLAQGVLSGATVVLQVLAGLLLAVVVLFFFLKDGDRMWSWGQSLVPRRHREAFRGAGEARGQRWAASYEGRPS